MTDSAKIRILIVEDHEISRIGLSSQLQALDDFELLGAVGDGRSAVKAVEELRPSVVLMDIGLPELDGIQATQTIKKNHPEVRVVMLTSHESDRDIFASLSAGADGYALKDITRKQLELAIRNVIEGTVWFHPEIAKRVIMTYIASKPKGSSKPAAPAHMMLTERELTVLALVVEGLGNQEIGERLFLSGETIKTHMRHILEKLAVSDRTQAAVKALREGLVEL